LGVIGEIHDAHPTMPQLASQDVLANDLAFDAFRSKHKLRRRRGIVRVEEVIRVCLEQGDDFRAEVGVAGAGAVEILVAFFRIALKGARIHSAEASRFFARHLLAA
jgi:hypothetical protein